MNIYIGNLDYNATDSDLQRMFEAFGEVSSANVIIDKSSGRSKGFGFVEMPAKAEAEEAITSLNDSDMNGRNITVNEARPRETNNSTSRNSFRSRY
ncbi:MAG: RNA-binding protein [Chlorobiaceae bacterium]|nr:RNA-binding protein [Chlorobiaceae bacterium]NTV60354.1 RNA-binding protein [Chlorobiaceae bacterium]